MSHDPETLYDTAQRMVGEGKLAAAEVLLRQAVELGGDSKLYLAGLAALIGLQEGRTEESVELLEEQLQASGDNPHLLVAYGMTLEAAGQEEKAAELFEKAVEKDPNHPAALYSLAQVKLGQGDLDAAEKMVTRAFALSPDHADYALMACEILEAQNKSDLAFEVAHIGAGFNPQDMDLVEKAVKGALAQDQPDRAWEILNESNQEVSWVVGWRATLLELEGKSQEADEVLDSARERFAEDPNFLFLEACIHSRRGDRELAMELVGLILNKEPQNPSALKLKAELSLGDESLETAIEALEMCHEAAPQDVQAQTGLMAAYYSAGRYEDACRLSQELAGEEEARDLCRVYVCLCLAALDRAEELENHLEDLPEYLVGPALEELATHGSGAAAETLLREALQERLPEPEPGPEPTPTEPIPEVPEVGEQRTVALPEADPDEDDIGGEIIHRPLPQSGPDFSNFFLNRLDDESDEDDEEYEDEDYEEGEYRRVRPLDDDDDDAEYEWVEVDDDEDEEGAEYEWVDADD